ncbi:hypothetical protein [Nocardioides sp. WS12]|uniref:hypothetical protein n=1 Tax=Nocardioides sp. WS12 TaxID=2486272 RepID=UPI0015FE2DEB|nr:hypothetical protein [Nocardioides sp. WS12]
MSEYDARLADRVRTRGALSPDDAAHVLLPVAESLVALHEGGRTHGAISPASIRIDAAGHATLLEPGAVAADSAFVHEDPIWGLRPQPAADDVWSFAAVLLHVTTGRQPAIGDADPRHVGWLAPLVELAMQTDPRDRPTMSDVADYLRAQVAPASDPRRISPAAMLLVGGAVILGLAAIGAALLFGGDDEREPRPTASTSAVEDEPATDEPTATASAEPVPASDLEEFARTYVATASNNPGRGFDLLTPTYQDSSPRYREVWRAIEDPEIIEVTGDPETLSVSYTYTYRLNGARRTEDVTLRLVQQGEQLLIAGASGRLR